MKMKLMWNLIHLYKSDADPRMKMDLHGSEEVCMAFIKKWNGRSDYLKDPDVLADALDEYEEMNASTGLTGDVGYYWGLRSAQDEDNTDIKAHVNKVHEIEVKLGNKLEFFSLKIAKIDKKLQKRMLAHKRLKPYEHFLERLFETAKYDLSEPEEKIMNLKSKTSHGNWVDMVSRFLAREEREVIDEDGKKKKKSFSQILELLCSQKKRTRDSAAKEFHDINATYADVAEAEFNSIMENKKFDDELRGYKRPDEARHVVDDMDSEVVDTMIKVVSDRFDIPRRYYKLKSKLMGVDTLAYHERNVPFGEVRKRYSFVDAVGVVRDVFSDIDPEFSDIFEKFVENGHFDVFPRKGKSSGAFCAHHLKVSPVYILLNFGKKLDDVLTIAHETGHGINNEFMRKSQNALNFGSPLSVAEVSSTFFEDFVLERLMEDADDKLRLALMMQKLNDEMSTVFRQCAGYSFEREVHEEFRKKGYLSKKEIGKIFSRNMKAYMGPFVRQDPGSENWWVYWDHFRRFFYVYTYASGLLISKRMQSLVRSDRSKVSDVKKVLSAGRSISPKKLFKGIGLDISEKDFWMKGISEVEKLLEETERLAANMGKV